MSLDQEIQEKSQELLQGVVHSMALRQQPHYFYVTDKWGRVKETRPSVEFPGLDSLIQTGLKPADGEQ